MKRYFLLLCITFSFSCAIHQVPVSIGDDKEKVHLVLGTEDHQYITNNRESYMEHGLVIEYTDNKVDTICVTLLNSGIEYSGYVFGIKIDDKIEKCNQLWGEPIKIEDWSFLGYNVGTWYYKDYVIEAEIWANDGDDSSFGIHKKNTIKNLTYWKK